MFRDRVRQFNKRVLNPQMMKIARSSWTPLAIVRHVGRRSGKPYQTPIIVKPVRGGFAIALTYGRAVDWYQNVVAAGRCTIIWHGKEYATGKPEPIDPERGLRIFPFPERLILRLLGTHDFVWLMYQGVRPADRWSAPGRKFALDRGAGRSGHSRSCLFCYSGRHAPYPRNRGVTQRLFKVEAN